jgi:hypothetical protein
MAAPVQAFGVLPDGLRDPLLAEYRTIISNFLERRWTPSELGGGKFCEIVYTILDGHAKGTYSPTPSKPQAFVKACRQLEQNGQEPRSFQILIPRMLPALYEVRSNRGVGHAGGDVDPNHMDATVVMGMANWIMGELIRVLHNLPIQEAQRVVDSVAERRVPLVWEGEGVKRVLRPGLPLGDEVLILVATSATPPTTKELMAWTDYSEKKYFVRLLRKLQGERKIEFNEAADRVVILPPGAEEAQKLMAKIVKKKGI